MYKRFLCISLVALLLAGCKVEHISRVTDSQLENPMQTIQATVKIEVAACTDYKDANKPSDSLTEANEIVKKLFSSSEFQECKRENLDSIATYLVPMDIGTIKADEKFEAKNITIAKNQYGNVFFCIPTNIVAGIKKYKQQKMIKDIDFVIKIRYVNDSGKDVSLDFLAAYADNEPFVQGTSTVPPDGNVSFVLSNVSSDQALEKGIAFAFSKIKDKKKQ